MVKKYCFPAFISLLFLLNSCRHETDLTVLPVISFNSDIQPILVPNCAESGCHDASGTARTPMVTYDDVVGKGRITAGNAQKSKLYQRIDNYAGQNVMPKPPNSRLSDDQIKMIYMWIEEGAKNN